MCRPHLVRVVLSLLVSSAFALGAMAQLSPETKPVINDNKTVMSAPAQARPLRVAIYEGPGSGDKGVASVSARVKHIKGAKVTRLSPEQVGTADLSKFDVIVFSGGSGSAQSKAIGEQGRAAVRKFVENGGGYVGVCAGAYLACAGFEWGLGILDAKTVSPKWRRGRAYVDVELTEEGRALFGDVQQPFQVRYANGPIIKPLGRDELPDYTVLAWFRSEVAENGTPAGVMVNSPAVVGATFGKGRVVTLSPHSEDTPGLENMLAHAFLWAAPQKASE